MREKDVPQDNNRLLGGERKAMYALDEHGRYTVVPSSGWDVEETVTSMAVEHYRQLAEEALRKARQGTASALEYHMYARRFNLDTLSQSVGMRQWRVKRHLKPGVYKKLSATLLERYARALGISVSELNRLP
jgi:hypothetical protein